MVYYFLSKNPNKLRNFINSYSNTKTINRQAKKEIPPRSQNLSLNSNNLPTYRQNQSQNCSQNQSQHYEELLLNQQEELKNLEIKQKKERETLNLRIKQPTHNLH